MLPKPKSVYFEVVHKAGERLPLGNRSSPVSPARRVKCVVPSFGKPTKADSDPRLLVSSTFIWKDDEVELLAKARDEAREVSPRHDASPSLTGVSLAQSLTKFISKGG